MLSVLVLGLSTLLAPASPPAIGFDRSPFSRDDVVGLVRLLAQENTPVWFLRALSFDTPGSDGLPKWAIEVYVIPDIRTARLRRGTILQFHKVMNAQAGAPAWRRTSDESQYAEVSHPKRPFSSTLTVPNESRLPFQVAAEISNDDLVKIVDTVRSPISAGTLVRINSVSACPEPASKRVVYDVRKVSQQEVDVSAGGCVFRMRHQENRWDLIEVATWVAY